MRASTLINNKSLPKSGFYPNQSGTSSCTRISHVCTKRFQTMSPPSYQPCLTHSPAIATNGNNVLLAFSPWCNVHHQLYHQKKKTYKIGGFIRVRSCFIMFYPQMSPYFSRRSKMTPMGTPQTTTRLGFELGALAGSLDNLTDFTSCH